MKICVLTHTFPRNEKDVAAAFMGDFCKGLVEAGNSVVVVTPFDEKFKREGDKFKIYTYKYMWPTSFHLLGYSRSMTKDIFLKKINFILLPAMIFWGSLALLKVVKREKVDIINVHWILPNGLIAWIIFKITGVPYVVTLPGTDAYIAFRYKILGFVAKIIARDASGIFSNSHVHLKRILDLGIKPRVKGVIIYPADISIFKPSQSGLSLIRKRHGLKKSDLVILSVGRLVYKKGFEYLIRAMSSVVNKYPFVKLLIGGSGELIEELTEVVKKLDLESNVIMIGDIYRDEIVKYYNLSEINIAPSIIDEMGNVDGGPVSTLESMACGKPQIVTNVLGMSRFIKNGVNGYVIKQKNIRSLSSSILKLVENKELREKMGINNRNLVINELSTKKIGEKYTQEFEKILKE